MFTKLCTEAILTQMTILFLRNFIYAWLQILERDLDGNESLRIKIFWDRRINVKFRLPIYLQVGHWKLHFFPATIPFSRIEMLIISQSGSH